jgi:hypothetical protein
MSREYLAYRVDHAGELPMVVDHMTARLVRKGVPIASVEWEGSPLTNVSFQVRVTWPRAR